MSTFCKIEDLITESDVEQKFIMPILTSPSPLGLGYDVSTILTKHKLTSVSIDKGNHKKNYFPDYIVQLNGLPMIVIEAKAPADENLEEAAREARLYASEINAKFPNGINPCIKIIVTNGRKTLLLDADSVHQPMYIDFNNMTPAVDEFTKFINSYKAKYIFEKVKEISHLLKPEKEFSKPIALLGSPSVRHQEISPNALGELITAEFRYVFNPIEDEERKKIAINAYVKSQRREKHSDPITKIIKSSVPPSVVDSKLIQDNQNPIEIINKINGSNLRNEVMLLIGSVGSGKSTFIDHFIECALPKELKATTNWIRLDMNLAPLEKKEIYNWLPENIIQSFKNQNPNVEFDALETIQKIYSTEVNAFRKGLGKLLENDITKFNEKLFEVISETQKDSIKSASCYNRYFCSEKGRLLVLVLDNCDKRSVDDQLLMFEVARWLKSQFRCLVVIPMRDSTFDTFRKEPPLDTVVKDLTFRIDSPSLSAVILKRIEFVFSEMEKDKGTEQFELSNGMRVIYPKSENGNFLRCILTSLFDNESFIRRVIEGLAGKNIRKGLEIFLDICKSGHIDNDELFAIRQANGDHTIPWNKLLRAMMKGGRKYYSDEITPVKNIFASDVNFDPPNPFVRWFILRWLKSRYKTIGPSGNRGYHRVEDMIKDLVPVGCDKQNILNETNILIKNNYILADEFHSPSEISCKEDTLISIAPPGHILLDLLFDKAYLSICSEDIWYSRRSYADEIRQRMISDKANTQKTALMNAKVINDFLEDFLSSYSPKSQPLINEMPIKQFLLFDEVAKELTEHLKQKNLSLTEEQILESYPPGKIISGILVNIRKAGAIIDFGEISGGAFFGGRIPNSISSFSVGDQVNAEVIKYSSKHHKLDVRILDTGDILSDYEG